MVLVRLIQRQRVSELSERVPLLKVMLLGYALPRMAHDGLNDVVVNTSLIKPGAHRMPVGMKHQSLFLYAELQKKAVVEPAPQSAPIALFGAIGEVRKQSGLALCFQGLDML